MDEEKPNNKAKPMKKRNVHEVHEHFEEVSTQLFGFSSFVKWPLNKTRLVFVLTWAN